MDFKRLHLIIIEHFISTRLSKLSRSPYRNQQNTIKTINRIRANKSWQNDDLSMLYDD